MKKLNDIFSNLKLEEIHSVFNKYGINVPDNFSFSNINIVIGINGSGKTRFLNAIKELWLLNNERVIYGYFPKLSDTKVNVSITDDNLPDATLYEALLYDNYDFDDFLEEIQNQNESYIADLLNYQSRVQKKRNDKIMTSFTDIFKKLTGFEIVVENKSVKLEQNGKLDSLNTVLSQFSPGQLMLFYLSIFISLQKSNSRKVIILDEPECHLHPNALLEFITLLKEMKCFSNLFIATHSLFLVPEFEFENIIYLDQSNIISRNSTIYHKLFHDMVGKDYDKKMQFFSSVNQWQYSEYLAECFTNPEVIDEINADDEQVRLFIEFLRKSKSVKILDFGAGSARLGRSLRETNYDNKSKIHYDVYDINSPKNTHGFNYFKTFDDIPKKYYDCVVMMNVLHEIDPLEWKTIFENLFQIMSDESYLLFVETSTLSKGELPNKTGYLVLGNDELQKLFGSRKGFPCISLSKNQKSICLVIRNHYLRNITEESIREAIKELEKNAYRKLITERNSENPGRKYAFFTQLYLNAKIFNEGIPLQKPKKKSTSTRQHRASNFSVKEKVDLSKKIINYISNVKFNDVSEIYVKELLNQLVRSIEYEYNFNIKLLNAIWQLIIKLEKENANKTLIAICLLSLALADYQKAANRFTNNNYIKYLPYDIKKSIKNTLVI